MNSQTFVLGNLRKRVKMDYRPMQFTSEFTDGHRLSWGPIVLQHTGSGPWEEVGPGALVPGSRLEYDQEVANFSFRGQENDLASTPQGQFINLETHGCPSC